MVFDMLELEDIPGWDSKLYIRTRFGKTIHFNCPLKLCNNFISFREPIYFSKQKIFFIEIFEITDNSLKQCATWVRSLINKSAIDKS